MSLPTRSIAIAKKIPRCLLGILLVIGAQAGRHAGAASIPVADPNTLRHTLSGDVIGFVSDEKYLRMARYSLCRAGGRIALARAPRYRNMEGVRQTLEYASPCMQPTDDEIVLSLYGGRRTAQDYIDKEKYMGSEDCLYLNIDTPRFAAGKVPTGAKRLPVMVYFHGGGNIFGWGGFRGVLAAREPNTKVCSFICAPDVLSFWINTHDSPFKRNVFNGSPTSTCLAIGLSGMTAIAVTRSQNCRKLYVKSSSESSSSLSGFLVSRVAINHRLEQRGS